MERYLKAIWDLQQFASEEVFKFLEHNKDEKLKLTWQYVSTLSNEKSQFRTPRVVFWYVYHFSSS